MYIHIIYIYYTHIHAHTHMYVYTSILTHVYLYVYLYSIAVSLAAPAPYVAPLDIRTGPFTRVLALVRPRYHHQVAALFKLARLRKNMFWLSSGLR